MPELHAGPDVSLGQLEAQLRGLGLAFNAGFYMTAVNGEWVLAVNDENYQLWQDAYGPKAAQVEEAEVPEPSKSPADEQESTEDTGTSAAAGNRRGKNTKGR